MSAEDVEEQRALAQVRFSVVCHFILKLFSCWQQGNELQGKCTGQHMPITHANVPLHAIAQGGYVGVRRVVRLLEVGDVAKHITDAAIDANSQLLNLRMSILK